MAAQVDIDVLQVEIEISRRLTCQHFRPVEGEDARPSIRIILELVIAHVIRVRPDCQLGIIVHIPIRHLKAVAIPRSQRVSGCRNGDALVEGAAGHVEGELAEDPTVSEGIEQGYGVAVIGGLAQPARPLPEGVVGGGRGDRKRAGGVGDIPEAEGHVDGLEVILLARGGIVADIPIGVRREDPSRIGQPLEVGQQGQASPRGKPAFGRAARTPQGRWLWAAGEPRPHGNLTQVRLRG